MILTKVTIDLGLLILLAILAGIFVLILLVILGFIIYIRVTFWISECEELKELEKNNHILSNEDTERKEE